MPDHLHAILSFPEDERKSQVIGDWKRYQKNQHDIAWQDNYFDYRIRNDDELVRTAAYIRNNPVVKELCEKPEDWPWVIDHFRGDGPRESA